MSPLLRWTTTNTAPTSMISAPQHISGDLLGSVCSAHNSQLHVTHSVEPVSALHSLGTILATTTTTSALAHAQHDTGFVGGVPILPVLGSSGIMLTIVALLYGWEKSVEWARETVPRELRPVVESILGEIGGLGFVGLVLQMALQGTNKEFLEQVSVAVFGEGEILVETFEYLHTAFFQVGVGFFLAAGIMVAVGLKKLEEIDQFEDLQVDSETGVCSVTAEKLTKYVPVTSTTEAFDKPPMVLDGPLALWREIFMPADERAGKTLLLRSRLTERFDLPDTFRVEQCIRKSFAQNLLEMVELSPLTWIYLIPALALANSIDLQHEVINAASPNAADSAGFFVSTPWAIIPSCLSVGISLLWGLWNCWKMTLIKYMVLPRVGKDPESGKAQFLPPPLDNPQALQWFQPQTSPDWVQPIEAVWAEPARTPFEACFGTAGAAGLELYRYSIKFQTWLCITHVVFFGTQIIPRDLNAIWTGAPVGNPEYLVPELITHGVFVALSLTMLIFVTSRSFWNLCLIQCLGDEKEVKKLLPENLL